ncbi:MAG: hypothetical protein NXH75_08870, partial [Halobacteriovoraceae bacterium]|nr:hypothetical protein [Halobacteriovoraceae bacterium]
MKAIFVALLSIVSLSVFSLPGEPAFDESELIGSCNAHVGVLEGSVLREFMRVSGCQGFSNEEAIEYCDCIDNLVGNSISTNEDFKNFKERVTLFDRQETAKARFVNEPRTIKLASMINMLAGSAETGPFDQGGKCEDQFNTYEKQLNASTPVKHKLADLSLHLKQQRNIDILNQNGVNDSTLSSFLEGLLIVRTAPDSEETHVNYSEPSDNEFFKLISESMELPIGESSIRMRVHDRVQAGATSTAISKEEAIEALCMNLAVSFQNEMSINQVHKPQGEYIDINSYISEKSLSPIDIPSFRGLKYLFSQTEGYDSERDELFFGQMMCQNINEDLFKNGGRSEKPEHHSLSKEDIKAKIIETNSFLETTSREYESAVRIDEELKSALDKMMTEIPEEFGISADQIENALKDISPDNPEYLAAAYQLVGEDSEKAADLAARLRTLNEKVIAYDQNQSKRNTFMGLLHQRQMEADNLFKELAYRFEGNLEEAADFIGKKELRSHSIRYFAEFDFNATGFQGPALPTHMALDDGEITGYTGDTLDERMRDRARAAERVGRVVRELSKDVDTKSLHDAAELGNALASIERGSTSKEMFSPVQRSRLRSTSSSSDKGRSVAPSFSNNARDLTPSPTAFEDRGSLTNEERAIIAQKKQLALGNSGSNSGGATDLRGIQQNPFSPDVITDNTEFGDFLNTNPDIISNEDRSIETNLESGLRSLEGRLEAIRKRQEVEPEEEPGPLDAQIEALTAEIEALRIEKERIDRENEEAREELQERERISSTLTDQPA